MAFVRASSVSVSYPVFSAASRSLKTHILSHLTGGRIDPISSRHLEVEAIDRVTFSLGPGDRVALIGNNGSGKSTLLRTIARIYHPRSGRMHVRGKVAALFDTSFGLDFEANAYENIYLRGVLFGVARAQMSSMIDDIAEFCELGEFLHMPLRTYSAGMIARLAFAISSAIDADVLLIDEGVGAVDKQFMNKANDRLKQFVERSPIVVVASHNDKLVRRTCTRGIVMQQGCLAFDGPIDDALKFHAMTQPRQDAVLHS